MDIINRCSNAAVQRCLRKRCSENMQQIYRRIPMPKCDFEQRNFIEITLRHRCSPVNLLYIYRTPFPKNNSGWLLLDVYQIGSIFKFH